MIYKCGDLNFKWAWLDLLGYDPVHPTLTVDKRISGNRTIFVYVENEQPQYIISAKISKTLCRNMNDILSDNENESNDTYAMFYSIFRVPGSTVKGGGGLAMKGIIDYCKMRNINKYYTLSPIPFLRKTFEEKPKEKEIIEYLNKGIGPVSKFHLSNGAKVGYINFDADESETRQNESWGVMVNYCYCEDKEFN